MKLRNTFYIFLIASLVWRYKTATTSMTEELFIAVNFHKKNQFEQAQYFYLKNLSKNPNCQYSLLNLSKIGSHLHKNHQEQLRDIEPITISMWAAYKFLSIYPHHSETKNLLLNNLSLISQENIFLEMPGLSQRISMHQEDILYLFVFLLSLICFNITFKKQFLVPILYRNSIFYLLIFVGVLNIFSYSMHPFLQEIVFPKKQNTPLFSSLSNTSTKKMLPAGSPLICTETIGIWKKISLPSGQFRYVLKNSVVSTKNSHLVLNLMEVTQ